jgi:hypothetical protein
MANRPNWQSTPVNASVAVTAANTSSQGGGTIGTDIFLLFTAGASGAFVERVRFAPTATTPTTTTATVGRVFVSSQSSGATTSANTHNVGGEATLPAIAAGNATASATPVDVVLNMVLAPNQSLLVTNHAAPAANTQWKATAIGAQLT